MSKTEQGKTRTGQGSTKKASARRKKKQQKKILIVVVEILVLLILAAVLFVVVKFSKIQKDTTFDADKVEVNEGISSEAKEIMQGYTTVALFGLDNRSNGNLSKGNSDVIIIASINNDTHEVKMASIYRDSYLDIGNGTFKKCNAAYSAGGPEQAISMLNKNLDLDITDYVTVDFNAVVECVDLLGGVVIPEVTDEEAVLMYGYMDEINKLTKHNSKYLSSGGTNVTMDGVQACAYSRIRYTAGNDYKRTERQRTVIAAMIEKAQSSNLKTINSLIDALFGDIKTSYTNTDLMALAAQVFNYKLGETTGFPFEKNTKKLGSKGDCVIPCDLESNVKQLHAFLYDDNSYETTDTVKKSSAQIINDTGYRQGDGY